MIHVHCWKIQRFVFADFQGDEVIDVAIDLTTESQELGSNATSTSITTTAAGTPSGTNGPGGKVGVLEWPGRQGVLKCPPPSRCPPPGMNGPGGKVSSNGPGGKVGYRKFDHEDTDTNMYVERCFSEQAHACIM